MTGCCGCFGMKMITITITIAKLMITVIIIRRPLRDCRLDPRRDYAGAEEGRMKFGPVPLKDAVGGVLGGRMLASTAEVLQLGSSLQTFAVPVSTGSPVTELLRL